MTMYSEHPSIKFVEHCLDEGRLDDIEYVPPYLGPLASTPRLREGLSLVVRLPNEALRHAKVWARVKRALRDAEYPNPYRSQIEAKPDLEFLTRNATYLLLRHLGIKCDFQWMVSRSFRHHVVAVPNPGGKTSPFAVENIHRPDRNIWSLAVYPVQDPRWPLMVAEREIWRDGRDSGVSTELWKAHAALITSAVIFEQPTSCFRVTGWAHVGELPMGKATQHAYDYVDRRGQAKIGSLACRQIADQRLRPIEQLFELLDGWDFDRLKKEGRLEVGGGLFRTHS